MLRQKVVQALYRDAMPKVYCRMDIKSVANYRYPFLKADGETRRYLPVFFYPKCPQTAKAVFVCPALRWNALSLSF